MTRRTKKNVYTLIAIATLSAATSCGQKPVADAMHIEGFTMGTTYQITYFDDRQRDFKTSIDSLLTLVNKSINNYDTLSEVSLFNRGADFTFDLPYFYPPLKKSLEIFRDSKGVFDLTVMPLVNAWGFGAGNVLTMDSSTVDSLRAMVGFDKIILTPESVSKRDPRVQLDFGGIGQGYGADVITDFFKQKGISDMLVELGGEGMAVGTNRKTNKPWTIGILDPNSTRENQFFKAYITLRDRSFTTSGNYFNYREVDGKKYSHTIDPNTGYPATQAILSASVFSEDCTTVDAWATAFMVMGHEKAIDYVKKHPELDAIIMFTSNGGVDVFISEGIKQNVILEQD